MGTGSLDFHSRVGINSLPELEGEMNVPEIMNETLSILALFGHRYNHYYALQAMEVSLKTGMPP